MVATVLWLTFAGAMSSFAQQNKENALGVLWQKVEAYYPGIGVKQSAVDAAAFREREVKGNQLPQLKAQAQNTYGTFEGSAGAFFAQPGTFTVNGPAGSLNGTAYASNTYGSATAELTLFSFGKLRNETEAAGAMYDKKVSEKDAYVLSLKKELAQRYITLLYNDAKFNWTLKNADRLNEIRRISAGLSASGLRPAADSLLATSSHTQVLGDVDQWTGFKNASVIKVLELYGGETLAYTAAAKRFSNVGTQVVNDTPQLINASHPVLTALEKQSLYYTLSAEAMKRSALPSVSLMVGYAYRGTGIQPNGNVSGAWKNGFNNGTNNFLTGIGLSWNLTGLHTNRLKSAGLFKDAESTKLQQTQYQQAMQADLSAAEVKITQQNAQLRKTSVSVKQAQDAYGMYLARYKSGLITLTELLQIRLILEQAENNHIEASRNYWLLLAHEAELTADFNFLFTNL